MKTNDIIKLFEKYIQKFNDKAVITLKKNLDNCSFKAYKKLTYSVHFIHRISKQGFILANLDHTARVTNEEEEKALIDCMDKKLLTWMFDWLRKTHLIDGNE